MRRHYATVPARAAAAAVSAAAAMAVAGCASPGGSAAASPAPAALAGSALASSAPASSAPASPVPASPVPASSGGPVPAPPAASPSATGPVAVSISGLPAAPALAPGGPALTFTVTLHNPGTRAYRRVTPLVSMGHCDCSGTPAEMAPAGTLEEQDPAGGSWHSVPYVREGGGMDFLYAVQQPAITLAPGASAAFTFRVAFTRQQPVPLHAGSVEIHISLVQLPAHSPIGHAPAAATVAVQP